MKTLLRRLLAIISVLGATTSVVAQPPAGSQLPPDENLCATCHGEKDLWENDKLRLFISKESLAEDIHFLKGVNCHDCHGGDPNSFDVPEAHSTVVDENESKVIPFRAPLNEVKKSCVKCHKDQMLALSKGSHSKVGERDAQDRGTPMACGKCHGEKTHGMLSVRDRRSPVFLDNQVRLCGGCHQDDLKTYSATVHGKGLYESGLLVTAVCADCHGAHGIYYAADKRSTLHVLNVAATCAKCHRFIEERVEKSVHGRGLGPGTATERAAPGGKLKRKPSCTDCHQGHYLLHPESVKFRLELPHHCGNCHPDLSSRYAMSLHGELTQLGYEAAATCSDCHGAHDILPISDPRSRLGTEANRLKTCRKCHLYAVQNFTNFDPHANHKDEKHYPALHGTHVWIENAVLLLFGVFVIHAFLWFWRSLLHALQYGRHKTLTSKRFAVMRLEPIRRVVYAMLVVSFLWLTLTGIPLKYSNEPWAHSFSRSLGGFGSTRIWHHFFAVVAIAACVTHLVWAISRILRLRKKHVGWKTIVFGPDSPVPGVRDVRDLGGMVRWFFGAGAKPRFERWTYWEKTDYWAMYLVIAIVGMSGLMLWYPNLFCTFLPGGILNLAKVLHSETAILIASYIFITHFFNTHFRPEKFPLDLSVLTGLVSEEHLLKARPEYIERMRREGTLDQIRRPMPSKQRIRVIVLGWLLVFTAGLGLLAAVLVASLGK